MHKGTHLSKHLHITKPVWSFSFWNYYSTPTSQPLLWFWSFYTITLHWSFYTYYTRPLPLRHPAADPVIPWWVNCPSCPWPQPFVAIRADFLRAPILSGHSNPTTQLPFVDPRAALSPFRARDRARDLSSSQTSYYTAQQQWALYSDAPRVTQGLSAHTCIVHLQWRLKDTVSEDDDSIASNCIMRF